MTGQPAGRDILKFFMQDFGLSFTLITETIPAIIAQDIFSLYAQCAFQNLSERQFWSNIVMFGGKNLDENGFRLLKRKSKTVCV